MIHDFNEKPNFPVTYGDACIENEKRLSDYVVTVAKNKRVQNHLGAVVIAAFALGMYAQAASAIPAEYGEAVNDILDQAGRTGAAGGGVPAAPPIGEIRGQVPVPQVNPQLHNIPAMPIEQQRLIAAQQAGQIGAMPSTIGGPAVCQPGADQPPIFWSPKKPITEGEKLRATGIFILSTIGICSQAGWNPIAQIMCAAGLGLGSYAVSKKPFLALFRSLSGG